MSDIYYFFLYTIRLPAITKIAPANNAAQRTTCVLSPVCGKLVLMLFALFESTKLPVTVVSDCFLNLLIYNSGLLCHILYTCPSRAFYQFLALLLYNSSRETCLKLETTSPNIRKIKIKLGRAFSIVYNNFADTASASQKGAVLMRHWCQCNKNFFCARRKEEDYGI